jgi:hypothetical protein
MRWDREMIRDIDYDVSISEGVDTPVFRQVMEDNLLALLDKQIIDGPIYLENSSMPYADKLLESINRRRQQLQEEQAPPPDAQYMNDMQQANTQLQQQANPQAMELINKALSVPN